MKNILVSVIIPCYNVQDYIVECVNSVFAQTYPNIEVICIDNNSTDETWNKLNDLQKKYPTLIIDKELNPGAPTARNKGLNLAQGEWIQFLDADDLLMPEKIEHQVSLLYDSTVTAFIAGACFKRNLNGQDKLALPQRGNPFKSLFSTQLGNTCSNLWNAKQIKRIEGWNESLRSSQEADLMFRLLKTSDNVIFDNQPLTIIRERPFGQISQGNHIEKWKRYYDKRIEIINWLKQNQSEHYTNEKAYYDDIVFGILKMIAENDLNMANSLYKEYFDNNYLFSSQQSHSTKLYELLFKVFGFYKTERIRRFLK